RPGERTAGPAADRAGREGLGGAGPRLPVLRHRTGPAARRPPAGELVGKQCPFCRIPADTTTRVVTCRCGVLYHHETAESHPHVSEGERLKCFEMIRACLSCGRPVTAHDYLVWDPASL